MSDQLPGGPGGPEAVPTDQPGQAPPPPGSLPAPPAVVVQQTSGSGRVVVIVLIVAIVLIILPILAILAITFLGKAAGS